MHGKMLLPSTSVYYYPLNSDLGIFRFVAPKSAAAFLNKWKVTLRTVGGEILEYANATVLCKHNLTEHFKSHKKCS